VGIFLLRKRKESMQEIFREICVMLGREFGFERTKIVVDGVG
jgi:hypothetical protein